MIEHFVAGTTAQAADLVGVNVNTAFYYFYRLRQIITLNLEARARYLSGEIEVDESYFGGARHKASVGAARISKIPVFGLLQRGGRVLRSLLRTPKRGHCHH